MSIPFMTRRCLQILVVMIPLVGCGGGKEPTADAAAFSWFDPRKPIDATLDCSNYCTKIQNNCMGGNLQYSSTDECKAACMLFPVGTDTDMMGNTLGCRIYHAGGPAMMAAETYCPRAGPGGDAISPTGGGGCSGGDVCASFCALEIKACGSIEVPLPGNPTDSTGNPLFQYRNQDRCMSVCAGFDKTHTYSTSAKGNSLACRLYRAVKAATGPGNAAMYCATTGSNPDPASDCGGAPSP